MIDENTSVSENTSAEVAEVAETLAPVENLPARHAELPAEAKVASDEAASDVDAEIAEYNRAVEAGEIVAEDALSDVQLLSEEDEEEIKAVEGDEAADEGDGAEGEPAIEFEFSHTSDINQFKREREEFLTLHGDNPIVATLAAEYDRQLAEFQPLAEATAQYGGRDEALKVLSAFNQLYVLDEESGDFRPNAEPIAKLLYEECPNEIANISERFLELPSRKYPGGTILQEIFLDSFKATPEKINNINQYLSRDDFELPAPVHITPVGVDKKLADAFQNLSENRRADIQNKAEALQSLKGKVEAEQEGDPNGYYARELQKELAEAAANFADDLKLLQDAQYRIDTERSRQTRIESVQKEAETRIRNETSNNFNTYVGEMIESQAKTLSDKMVFFDESMRVPQARAIISRIQGALSFIFDEELNFSADPMAAYHAKTLRDEGLNYDFQNGRDLFQKQIRVENKLVRLKSANASPRQLARVQTELTDLKNQINAEIHSLSAQYSKKFLSSNSQKLKNDLTEAERKNPASRPVVRANTKPGESKKQESIADIDRERRAHNQRIQKAIETGDLDGLKDQYV